MCLPLPFWYVDHDFSSHSPTPKSVHEKAPPRLKLEDEEALPLHEHGRGKTMQSHELRGRKVILRAPLRAVVSIRTLPVEARAVIMTADIAIQPLPRFLRDMRTLAAAFIQPWWKIISVLPRKKI